MTGVRLRDTVTGETSELAADGLFVAIGHDPNTALFLDWLDHDEQGYLVTRARLDEDEHPRGLRRRRRPGPRLPAGGHGRGLWHDGRARRAAVPRGGEPPPASPARAAPRRWLQQRAARAPPPASTARRGVSGRRRRYARGTVSGRWIDLLDPTREELLGALPDGVDPDVVDLLAARAGGVREPRPFLEGHGGAWSASSSTRCREATRDGSRTERWASS